MPSLQVPCPVKIDFGNITLDIRELMVQRKKSQFKAATQFTYSSCEGAASYINKIMVSSSSGWAMELSGSDTT